MISDAIEYPLEGDDAAVTLVIGGIVYLFATFLVVPGILVGGYSVAVCRGVLEGRREPPAFDDWGRLAVDGLYVVAISLVYWIPGMVIASVGFGAFLVVTAGVGGDAGALGGALLFLLAAVGSLLSFAYALVVGYVMPAAIVNFARTGELSAAWDLGTIRSIAGNGDYAKAWLIGVVLLFAFNSAASSLVWILVGFPILFFGQVAAMYVFTRGTMDALGIEPEQPRDERGRTGPDAGGVRGPDDTGGVPGPDDPVTRGGTADADGASAADAGGGAPAGSGDESGERAIEDVAAVGPTTADALRDAGFETVADLRAATRAELSAVDGIGPATANRIKSNVEQ